MYVFGTRKYEGNKAKRFLPKTKHGHYFNREFASQSWGWNLWMFSFPESERFYNDSAGNGKDTGLNFMNLSVCYCCRM